MHFKIEIQKKAANILIGRDGSIKLADFGEVGQITPTMQKHKTFVGTPYWMAPEVITQSEYDEKADIWGLGVVCFELIQGKPPHSGQPLYKALFIIVNSEPPRIDKHHTYHFQNFVSSCMEKNPNNRPSAAELYRNPWFGGKKFKKSVILDLLSNAQNKRNKTQSQSNKKIPQKPLEGLDQTFTDDIKFDLYPEIKEPEIRNYFVSYVFLNCGNIF